MANNKKKSMLLRSSTNNAAVILSLLLLCVVVIFNLDGLSSSPSSTVLVSAFTLPSVRPLGTPPPPPAAAPWTQSSDIHHHHHRRYLQQPVLNRAGSTTDSALSMMISPSEAVDLLNDVTSSSISTSSLITSVEVFDGSSIVDPVVVSNAFWDGLTRQFVSFLIGQVLAVTVFGVVTTIARNQIVQLGTFVSDNVFKQQATAGGLKKPPPGYTGQLRVEPDFSKLLICIVIDIIGTSSELIPFVGELTDLVWAPIAALLLRNIYGSNVVFALEFAEEFMLFTDALPLACICWVIDTYYAESEAAKVLQLGIYSSKQQQQKYDSGSADPMRNDDGWRNRQEVPQRDDRGFIDVDAIDTESERREGRQLPPDRRT